MGEWNDRADTASVTEPYRPVSVLAIAGLGLAVLFAAGVVVAGLTAVVTGMPLIVPWFLSVAVAGFGLSLAGWLQVRRSEGTRAGLGLARWGMGLALVFGVGYLAYIAAKEIAVRIEAQAFADGWMQKMLDEDVHALYAAFLETLPPVQRQGDDPRDIPRLQARYGAGPDGRKGELSIFLEQQFVRQFQGWGKSATFESQGVRSWGYAGDGFLVELNYRIHAPDGEYDVIVPVHGSESPRHFAGRQWHVVLREDPLYLRKR